MAIKEEFEIIIDEEGGVEICAKAFRNQGTKVDLKSLLNELGADEVHVHKHTDEFFGVKHSVDSKLRGGEK
jgi:hypothetical protein